jgi:hypothetical protein
MARLTEDLTVSGHASAAQTVARARWDMRDAGHKGGRGAEQTRQRVVASLESLAAEPAAQLARDDVDAAIRWVRKAGEIDREVSAKRHLPRQSSRDIARR